MYVGSVDRCKLCGHTDCETGQNKNATAVSQCDLYRMKTHTWCTAEQYPRYALYSHDNENTINNTIDTLFFTAVVCSGIEHTTSHYKNSYIIVGAFH